MSIDLLGELGEGMTLMEGELTATEEQDFILQFQKVCSCKSAIEMRGIVYLWFTEKPIPRVKECSPVVYIGKTVASLRDRHYRYARIEAQECNLRRYAYIMKKYGPIRIACKVVTEPRAAEQELFRRYMERHLELPPINASG